MTQPASPAGVKPWPRRPRVRYSEAVTRAICERLAAGEPWSRIAEDPAMPTYSMLYIWRRRHPAFAEAVRMALEAAADRHMDAALEVSEDVTRETVPVAKVRIEALRARTARLDAQARRVEEREEAREEEGPTVFHIEIVRFGREAPDAEG